jgi:CIC family chloride channel protein
MNYRELSQSLNPVNLVRNTFSLYLLVGITCGFVAVAFHLSIQFVFDHLRHFQDNQSTWLAISLMIVSPATGGLIVGLALQYIEPAAGGGGIPQAKAAFWNNESKLTFKEGLWRYILGIVSIGSGNSLGREGPTLHLCATIASQIGQRFHVRKTAMLNMIPVGMGAGIAAGFNAPLAAVTFVVEELLLSTYRTKAMAGIVFAAVTAAAVERIVLGSNPIYRVNLAPFEIDWWMLVCLPIGVLAGLIGHFFIKYLLDTRQRVKSWEAIPPWAKPALGGLGMGMIGTIIFLATDHSGIFGLGYTDLNETLNGKIVGLILLALLVGKILATIFSFSFGGSGGIFAPSLFIGTMLGGLLGFIMVQVFNVPTAVLGGSALLGMGAFFAATIRTPFTSVLVIYEMTGNYSLILPLMFGNMIAFNIAERFRPTPTFDALLMQDGIYLNYQSDGPER